MGRRHIPSRIQPNSQRYGGGDFPLPPNAQQGKRTGRGPGGEGCSPRPAPLPLTCPSQAPGLGLHLRAPLRRTPQPLVPGPAPRRDPYPSGPRVGNTVPAATQAPTSLPARPSARPRPPAALTARKERRRR